MVNHQHLQIINLMITNFLIKIQIIYIYLYVLNIFKYTYFLKYIYKYINPNLKNNFY